MTEWYFDKFPKIHYNNIECVDLSRHVKFSDKTKNVPTLFYPYEIKAGQRADWIAHAYYDDSTYDWMIYLVNGIVDPYYSWYLDEEQFKKFITDKYGSIEAAIKKIRYYRLNWSDDDVDISPSFYNSSLPYSWRKYYVPNYGYSSRVISYSRRREDWVMNTNRILNFNISLVGNSQFVEGEVVDIESDADFGSVGSATVITANSTVVTVQHVSGNTEANNYIVGETSGANAQITDTDVVHINIPDDEAVFWSPVTAYDWEREKNEEMKVIQLLDANYALQSAEALRLKLQEE